MPLYDFEMFTMEGNGLKTTVFNRYIQSAKCFFPRLIHPFLDETGKPTWAKYRLVGGTFSPFTAEFGAVYRLDGRSIRNMKRARIVENERPRYAALRLQV